jgi:hypothetical protein
LNNFSIPGFFFGISLILSMACFYFSWNMYHLVLNFEELSRFQGQLGGPDRGRQVAFEENLPLQVGSLHASNQQHESSSDYDDGHPGQFKNSARSLFSILGIGNSTNKSVDKFSSQAFGDVEALDLPLKLLLDVEEALRIIIEDCSLIGGLILQFGLEDRADLRCLRETPTMRLGVLLTLFEPSVAAGLDCSEAVSDSPPRLNETRQRTTPSLLEVSRIISGISGQGFS